VTRRRRHQDDLGAIAAVLGGAPDRLDDRLVDQLEVVG